jgi:hypothetical protein
LPSEDLFDILPQPSIQQTAENEKVRRAIVSAASLCMHGKLFAMSFDQQYSFLLPLDALKGDFICIVLGCSFPLVLRRFESRYWLVGEAYVHNIMRGETMEDFQTGKYIVEDFQLQ